jgi:hypothetical protein
MVLLFFPLVILVLTSLFGMLLVELTYLTFLTKRAILMRRFTAVSITFQQVLSVWNILWIDFMKRVQAMVDWQLFETFYILSSVFISLS